jgi:hypothetical protein
MNREVFNRGDRVAFIDAEDARAKFNIRDDTITLKVIDGWVWTVEDSNDAITNININHDKWTSGSVRVPTNGLLKLPRRATSLAHLPARSPPRAPPGAPGGAPTSGLIEVPFGSRLEASGDLFEVPVQSTRPSSSLARIMAEKAKGARKKQKGGGGKKRKSKKRHSKKRKSKTRRSR